MKRLLIALLFAVESALAQAPPISSPMNVIGVNPGVVGSDRPNDGDGIISKLLPEARGKTTLIGGTIKSLDRIRDRLIVRVFGGNDLVILFDGRTHVFRDGNPVPLSELRAGERVYADTTLAGRDTFARSVRMITRNPMGRSQGQVVSYDAVRRELAVRDLSAAGLARFSLSPNATILRGDRKTASPAELREGAIVSLNFTPSTNGQAVAQEVSVLAAPGEAFVFVGRISYLDLPTGLLVLLDSADNKSYKVHFDPATSGVDDRLREGAEVVVTTTFDGTRYTASNIAVGLTPNK